MRTFVFSATMSKELQLNLKRKGGTRKFIPRANEGEMTSLDDLLDKLDFRDPDPEIIDLSPEHGLVETLKECKIECLQQEKVRRPDVLEHHSAIEVLTWSRFRRTFTSTTSSCATPLARSSSSPPSTASVDCIRCWRCSRSTSSLCIPACNRGNVSRRSTSKLTCPAFRIPPTKQPVP
jgi:hypothetical protein